MTAEVCHGVSHNILFAQTALPENVHWSGLRPLVSPTVAIQDPLWDSPQNTVAPFHVPLQF